MYGCHGPKLETPIFIPRYSGTSQLANFWLVALSLTSLHNSISVEPSVRENEINKKGMTEERNIF